MFEKLVVLYHSASLILCLQNQKSGIFLLPKGMDNFSWENYKFPEKRPSEIDIFPKQKLIFLHSVQSFPEHYQFNQSYQ
jgi:hypothetical protein